MNDTTEQNDVATGANPPLVHPGPAAALRRNAVPSRAETFEILLEAGRDVEGAIRDAFDDAGFASGCALIDRLDCDPLRYVIPAEPDDPSRLAWYSATHAPEGECVIEQGFMSVGRDGAACFTHCHGVWRLADGRAALGHLIGRDTIVAKPCRVQAVGFRDAVFDRHADAETGFSLFAALSSSGAAPGDTPGAVAITLRPNEDISIAVEEICADLGIAAARVHGLGSLNGAEFEDGSRMDGSITEFLIRSGRFSADTGARIEIAAVDVNADLFAGVVTRGKATVSITSELVIQPETVRD